jgi:hypothetical protein
MMADPSALFHVETVRQFFGLWKAINLKKATERGQGNESVGPTALPQA